MRSERYVVDASVAIKLFIKEPLSYQAESLFSILEAAPAALYVPDLSSLSAPTSYGNISKGSAIPRVRLARTL
jgi:predicted nucleic acid-binding protein